MVKRLLISLAVPAFLVLNATAQASLCPEPPSGALSYKLSGVQEAVQSGNKVRVILSVENVSREVVPFWVENIADPGGLSYFFEVRNPHNKPAPESRFGLALKGAENPRYLTSETPLARSGGCIDLQQGESKTYTIDVGRLYDMSIPGTYTITAINKNSNGKMTSHSNAITVTIVSSQAR